MNLAKKPAGPFAPKRLSLLPEYAPRPIELDFCSKIAIVSTIAKTNCKTKNKVLTAKPFIYCYLVRLKCEVAI